MSTLEIICGAEPEGSGDMAAPGVIRMEETRKLLFKQAMHGDWECVKNIFTQHSFAREAKITRAGDTVLHLAVMEGDERIVRALMDVVVQKEETYNILSIKDDGGNTPLHLAASLGMAGACGLMASKGPKLVIEARNKNGETPLFVAARHGKNKAFFALQCVIEAYFKLKQGPGKNNITYCRRQDGNTILHVAVNGEYFDLALEIIQLYPDLVNYINERGESALHLLADKPSVFKSGSRLRRTDNLIYSCVIVDPLEVKYEKFKKKAYSDEPHEPLNPQARNTEKWTTNYKACLDLFAMLKQTFLVFGKEDKQYGNKHKEPSLTWEKKITTDDSGNGEGSQGRRLQEEQANQKDMAKLHLGSLIQSWIPSNYFTCIDFLKLVMKILLVILGIGLWRIENIQHQKEIHVRACQIMDELVSLALSYEYEEDGKEPIRNPQQSPEVMNIQDAVKNASDMFPETQGMKEGGPVGETPILVAAKRGVKEMVKKILDTFPVAALDVDTNDKNIVLLAVEHRQPQIYRLMLKRNKMMDSIFGKVDNEGNSALHLTAKLGLNHPWIIPGAALQMQWEIKWHEFVKSSVSPNIFAHYNKARETAGEIFTEKHRDLVKEGGKWLTNTSQSCSVIAALIATVAFASATTVPGGANQNSGFPIFEGQPAFQVFAISALIALCFSVTSLIMFLSILTSRYQEMDFKIDLPVKLMLGLTSLFLSIAAMLVSFCAGHFFVIEEKLKYAAYPIYAITCLPVTFFAVAQFPLYIDLIKATFAKVPERT